MAPCTGLDFVVSDSIAKSTRSDCQTQSYHTLEIGGSIFIILLFTCVSQAQTQVCKTVTCSGAYHWTQCRTFYRKVQIYVLSDALERGLL